MIASDTLMALSRALGEPDNTSDFLGVAAAQLLRILPGDDLLWVDSDFPANAFIAWRASDAARDARIERMMPGMIEHPGIQSYLRNPHNLAPRRLTDVPGAADWPGNTFPSPVREVLGRHQLALIVDVEIPGRGRGWVLTRDGTDYADEDVRLAAFILPVLLAYDRLHRLNRSWSSRCEPPGGQLPDGWDDLSPRERQVADLLSGGSSAVAIGNALGISPRTVNKHLEHIYAKLGRHDRLLVAVDRMVKV